MTYITQTQVLYRIEGHLELALRECWHLKQNNTLDEQIQRIRSEIRDRVLIQRQEDAEKVEAS